VAVPASDDPAEFAATVDALCDLEANDQLSLIRLAEARAQCLGLLDPGQSPRLSASERQRLQRRCMARGVGALNRAVDLGYDNVRRLDGDIRETGLLWNFRSDPAYSTLIETMRAK
jgi:hypothetical protein